jgi:hypothetical protein
MELEMAEGQGERLRKDNLALQRRLQAALAALAAYGSPLAGPGGMAARMAQVPTSQLSPLTGQGLCFQP